MTCIIFTSNPQNYAILKFPQDHEHQTKPSNSSKVIKFPCKKTLEKEDSELNDYLEKIIDDMFAQCADYRKAAISKPTFRVIEGGREVNSLTMGEKVREERLSMDAPPSFSRNDQGAWGKVANLKKYPIINFLLCKFLPCKFLKGEKK